MFDILFLSMLLLLSCSQVKHTHKVHKTKWQHVKLNAETKLTENRCQHNIAYIHHHLPTQRDHLNCFYDIIFLIKTLQMILRLHFCFNSGLWYTLCCLFYYVKLHRENVIFDFFFFLHSIRFSGYINLKKSVTLWESMYWWQL